MGTSRLLRSIAVSVAIGATSATSQAQGQQPTFRATVDVVPVDVNVIDSSGRPVPDLTLDEFSLSVGGHARRLQSAEFISLRRLDSDRDQPSAFSTNTGRTPGRLIMIVIDQANIRRGTGKEAFRAAARFIDTLSSSDRVALQIIPGTGPVSDFTANHALVKIMLERAVGQGGEAERSGRVGIAEAIAVSGRGEDIAWQGIIERECAGLEDAASTAECRQRLERDVRDVYTQTIATAHMSLLSLRSIIDRLALTTDPKTIVLISEGLVVEQDITELAWLGPQMAAAHVTIYGMRLSSPQYSVTMTRTSPSRDADQALLARGMDEIVGSGGGTVFSVGVNADVPFARLGREISAYYLLSFEPEAADRDGKTHDIAVRVSRRGLSIRARPQFSADPIGTVKTPAEALTATLRSALSASDFGLSLNTFSYQDDATGRIKVILGADIDRTADPAGPLSLAYYVRAQGGGLVWGDEEQGVLPPPGPPGQPQHFMRAFVLDPGAYTVRLAVVDEHGRRASVERQFDARITALGQIRIGDLMLARPGLSAGKLRPVIDGRVESDSLVAYTELYSQAAPQLAGAALRIEIASSESGRALETGMMTLAGVQDGKRAAQGSISVTLHSDGAYLARVVLVVAGRDVGQVIRPFTIARGRGTATAPDAVPLVAGTVDPPASVMPIAFESRLDRFDRQAVLTRAVMAFFMDRLAVGGVGPLPPSLERAVGLARMGQFSDILKIVDASGSDHVGGRFLGGLADLAQGRLDDAAAKFLGALKTAPAFFPAAFYLGATYAAAGQDKEAVLVWRSALIRNPATPWTYTVLSDALMRLGDHTRALQVLEEAVKEWPRSDDVLLRWATILSLTGEGEAAVRALDPYLARHADDADRLMLAMRLIYEARVSNRSVESIAADRARFVRYFDAYLKTGGPDRALAEQWKRFVDR